MIGVSRNKVAVSEGAVDHLPFLRIDSEHLLQKMRNNVDILYSVLNVYLTFKYFLLK